MFISFQRFLAAVGFGTIAFCNTGAATEAPVPTFEIAINGSEIKIQLAGMTRQAVLTELLGKAAAVEWLGEPFADEPITGDYRGTTDQIVAALLDRYNFMIRYETHGTQHRISRIVVLGPVPSKASA